MTYYNDYNYNNDYELKDRFNDEESYDDDLRACAEAKKGFKKKGSYVMGKEEFVKRAVERIAFVKEQKEKKAKEDAERKQKEEAYLKIEKEKSKELSKLKKEKEKEKKKRTKINVEVKAKKSIHSKDIIISETSHIKEIVRKDNNFQLAFDF